MMKEDTRMVATIVIWACFTIIIGIIAASLALSGADLDGLGIGALVLIVISLIVSVVESTKAVWGFKSDEADDDRARSAKAKNRERSRVERLIAELDDDEIYDLEALLLARDSDGELAHKQEHL